MMDGDDHAVPAWRPMTYHIQDIALLADSRGGGGGSALVDQFAARARAMGLAALSLVAVSGTEGFWRRRGFAAAPAPAYAEELRSYGEAALLMRRELA